MVQTLPLVYLFYKYKQKQAMNAENNTHYEFRKVGTKMEVAEIPEGKIYLVDAEGNGAGKYPVFVSKKENADFEGMVNKVLETLKQLVSPNDNEVAEPFVLGGNPNVKVETIKTKKAKNSKTVEQ